MSKKSKMANIELKISQEPGGDESSLSLAAVSKQR